MPGFPKQDPEQWDGLDAQEVVAADQGDWTGCRVRTLTEHFAVYKALIYLTVASVPFAGEELMAPVQWIKRGSFQSEVALKQEPQTQATV